MFVKPFDFGGVAARKMAKRTALGFLWVVGCEGVIKLILRDAVCSPKFEIKAKVDPRIFYCQKNSIPIDRANRARGYNTNWFKLMKKPEKLV